MKKFIIKPSFLGRKITGKIGVIPLTENTSQKDLKKLYNAGFTNAVEVIEVKEDDSKETK